ncbi:MAG: V-type ATP synthase subunit I [bacterium]
MSVVDIQKIHLVSLKRLKDQILKCLQENEVMDIQMTGDGGMERLRDGEEGRNPSQLDYELAEIKSAIVFLESVLQQKKSFIEGFIPPKEEVTEKELAEVCKSFRCADVVTATKTIEAKLANLHNLKTNLTNELALLLPWQNLNCQLNDLDNLKQTKIITGSLKTKAYEILKAQIKDLAHLELVGTKKDQAYILAACLQADYSVVQELLARAQLNQVNLPSSNKSVKGEISEVRSQLKNVWAEEQDLVLEAKKLARQLNKLKYRYDFILEAKTKLEVKQKLANTRYTFVIEGWVKKSDWQRLTKALTQVTPDFEIFKMELDKDEKPPVALRNPGPASPFELITKIYGTPKYNEIDPTIPLSFFFALFFGLCLGDFGYGLALGLISIYFLKRYRLPEGGRNLFKLLIWGGGVSMIVGILTGSYFGLNPKDISPVLLPLKQLLLSVQIIDPVKSPLNMLVFSLALGVVQILFGIILQMAWKIKDKEYVSAVLDDGLWLFFLVSLVVLLVSNALSLPSTFITSRLSMLGAVLLVLTQGRHKKGIVQKFFSGLLSLYKISGYMGDTLSYSRLLALGMSSAIIGSVINILAGMLRGGPPVIGVILMVLLLIFGHLFNLVISTLSAFVHSTRLQMVEFFSKFYEGGGREFRPYKRVAEYTIIK